MTYSNEPSVSAQIANAKIAASFGDKDSAFDFLSAALDCSDRNSTNLSLIDAAYAEIKE
jgi:hypothetical protein